MGVFLDKPKKEKETESGEGNGLRYGMCSMQGWRVEMEDAHTIRIELGPELKNCSFFAVFDGHAGDFVSKYSSENLIETILDLWLATPYGKSTDSSVKTSSSVSNNEEVSAVKCSHLTDPTEVEHFREKVIEGFLQIDGKMRELPKFKSGEERSGTTAVTAFVTPNKVIFANCGDSRALICSNSTNVKFATHDHKPYNEKERQRIENAGGSVMIQRVNGSLAVSRALGDYDYKNVTGLPPTEQLVSAEPDLNVIDRSEDDEFLILACDGVWDVMTNLEVVHYMKSRLLVHEDLQKICEELLETCLAKGSRDNMSVILITFPAAPKVCTEAVEKDKQLDILLKKKVEEIVKENGNETTLGHVLDNLQNIIPPDDFPKGGGIHSKLYLIEETLDILLPNKNKDENRGVLSSLPVPLSMMRQLDSGVVSMESGDDFNDEQPGDESGEMMG